VGALDGCDLKLKRAEEHLKCLEAKRVELLAEERPYAVFQKYDAETSCVLFTAQLLDELPPDWGVIVGDYVHNVRSALDHLAWQLACLHYGREPTGKNGREVAFPITASHTQFMDFKGLRHVAFEHVAFFERSSRTQDGIMRR
jgi:hypothetical protein